MSSSTIVVHFGAREATGQVAVTAEGGLFDPAPEQLSAAEEQMRRVLLDAESAGVTITAAGHLRCEYGSQPDRSWSLQAISGLPENAYGLSERDRAVHYLLREVASWMNSYVGEIAARRHGLADLAYVRDLRVFGRGLPAGINQIAKLAHFPDLEGNPLMSTWRACPNDLIGGWCVVSALESRSPAEGALVLAEAISEEMAQHLVDLHNAWLETQIR